jgi:hypothetical protein
MPAALIGDRAGDADGTPDAPRRGFAVGHNTERDDMTSKDGSYKAPKFTPPPSKAPAAPKVQPFHNKTDGNSRKP